MQATGVAPSKLAMQEWQKCMSWGEVFKWHATHTPWISDTAMIKAHYEKVLSDLSQQINQTNPQLEEQIKLKKKNDIEEESIIKKKLRELQEQEDKLAAEENAKREVSIVKQTSLDDYFEKKQTFEEKQIEKQLMIEEEEFQIEKQTQQII